MHVAAVFAETHRELSFLNDFRLVHNIVNRFESVKVHRRPLLAQPQDAIGLLAEKVLGLRMDATEGILEFIFANSKVFSKVKLVLDDVALIARTLGIPLVKAALAAILAPTVNILTVVNREGCRLFGIV